MTDPITPNQFDQAEGVEDWHLTSEGALHTLQRGSLGSRTKDAILLIIDPGPLQYLATALCACYTGFKFGL